MVISKSLQTGSGDFYDADFILQAYHVICIVYEGLEAVELRIPWFPRIKRLNNCRMIDGILTLFST